MCSGSVHPDTRAELQKILGENRRLFFENVLLSENTDFNWASIGRIDLICRTDRNLLLHLFDQNFVKVTFLLNKKVSFNKELISRDFFSVRVNFFDFHSKYSVMHAKIP